MKITQVSIGPVSLPGMGAGNLKAFVTDTGCRILAGIEPFGENDREGWHMSISHPDRNPTWEEIRDARYELCPGNITMTMYLPPKEEYVNVNEHCFHLFESWE